MSAAFQTALLQRKGDFIFQTGHVIEIVTKIFLVVKNAVGKHPEIQIAPEYVKISIFFNSVLV